VGNVLVRPPVADNPPLALRFDAPSIGLRFAVCSPLGLMGASISLGQMVEPFSKLPSEVRRPSKRTGGTAARQGLWSGQC